MSDEILSMKNDVVFKKFFTENTDLLKAFISDMTDIPLEHIGELTFIETELPPDTPDGKFSRLDMNIALDGVLVNVEVQCRFQDYYIKRALFYWAKLFASPLRSGAEYDRLQRTITINVVDFNINEDERFHSEVVPMYKHSHKVFTDMMSIYFLELKKIPIDMTSPTNRELWGHLFNASTKKELDMFAEINNPTMSRAADRLAVLSEDDRLREIARQREKAERDYNSEMSSAIRRGVAIGERRGLAIGEKRGVAKGRKQGVAVGRQQGLAVGEKRGLAIGEKRGVAKGRKQGTFLIAKNLKQMNMTYQQIAAATGLSIAEIEKL